MEEYQELYRIALTYTDDTDRAKELVEMWYRGRLQTETKQPPSR